MKKIFNLSRIFVVSYLLITLMATQSFAQCNTFTAAAITATQTQGAQNISYTGNDSRISSNGLSPMEVSVWDDNGHAKDFSWTYHTVSPCILISPLPRQ